MVQPSEIHGIVVVANSCICPDLACVSKFFTQAILLSPIGQLGIQYQCSMVHCKGCPMSWDSLFQATLFHFGFSDLDSKIQTTPDLHLCATC